MGKNAQEVSLDQKLMLVYKQYGVKTFLDVCSQMLSTKDSSNWEKKKKSNGEVCEVVLRVLTQNYLLKHHYEGSVFQSTILGDLANPRSEFKTELDFLLMTPAVCLTGECKSFVGDIVVTDECTLTRDSLTADVSKQSKLHARCLKKYLEQYVLSGSSLVVPPYALFCFVYSNGTLVDKRTKSARSAIPVLTIKTLYTYYDNVFFTMRRQVYDYKRACQDFKRFSESKALHDAHRKFLGY